MTATGSRWTKKVAQALAALVPLLLSSVASAGETDLVLPPLDSAKVTFFGGMTGFSLLGWGLVICILGLIFGFAMFLRLRALPVHRSMKEISELIYETCKTYLITQGKFLAILWAFIAVIMVVYFAVLRKMPGGTVSIIIFSSIIGIMGSYGVAWFGIRINTYANSRTAFASLAGKPYPCYSIPLQAGMSIGMLLISIELVLMLCILLFVPKNMAGACFIGFAIGESLGAAALRIAGGIFTKIADIGSDLMKIVFKIKEDDARNPGVIADCTGDNAGDSVGPTADGFETYGVTGVALITFILLAIPAGDLVGQKLQIQLLVWIFVMRVMMIVTSGLAYGLNELVAKARYGNVTKFNFETPLTSLVWLTSLISVGMTYLVSFILIRDLNGDTTMWWKLSTIITCGTLAGAVIPELVKVFTSTTSRHVREVVTASKEGGPSLNVLSGLVAGNFSAFWMGFAIIGLMTIAFYVSTKGLGGFMAAPAVFAFGLVAFGFLGMGPVTIAVDSYGPVTDNAQSVYELSTIETIPDIKEDIKTNFGFEPDFEKGKEFLEENDGAGNTFKATAKPVLIGTAVVGATTLVFSIIFLLAKSAAVKMPEFASMDKETFTKAMENLSLGQMDQLLHNVGYNLSLLNAPFLLGLVAGGAVIFWFAGAATQAVSTGAYRAVEFIKANIKLDGSAEKASIEDSKKVVAICTKYAQKGMFNIFIAIFFFTLAFACVDAYFFIGYLISIAIFGLYQAIFMANAGGAWDNAKKLVETDLKAKGTPLHDASIVGDTVGDPFKDTSSVAMNPVIKFTTLFGLLAMELALEVRPKSPKLIIALAGIFFVIALVFVYQSFYGMRIGTEVTRASLDAEAAAAKAAAE